MAESFQNLDTYILALNRYESLYNRKKEEFYSKVQIFYKQQASASVIKESELKEDIDELAVLKEQIIDIRDYLMKNANETISNPNFILFRC